MGKGNGNQFEEIRICCWTSGIDGNLMEENWNFEMTEILFPSAAHTTF